MDGMCDILIKSSGDGEDKNFFTFDSFSFYKNFFKKSS